MSPTRKDNKIELGASCFRTNTLPFSLALTLLLKRKCLSSHMKGLSSLPIILKIKRILSHIYKTKISHFPLLKQI